MNLKKISICCPVFVIRSVMAAGPRAAASVLLFGMKRMPYESLGTIGRPEPLKT